MEIFHRKLLGHRKIIVAENWVMEIFHGKLSRKTLSHRKLWVMENFESQKTFGFQKNLSHGKLSRKTLSHRKIWVTINFKSLKTFTENFEPRKTFGSQKNLSHKFFCDFKFAQIVTFPPVFGSKMRKHLYLAGGYLGANILAHHTQ